MNIENLPTRPDKNSSENMRAVAEKIYPQILDWLQSVGDKDDGTLLDEIFKCINKSHYDGYLYDGYSLAKIFEDNGWEPNEDLVTILSGVGPTAHHIQRENIKNWVKDNDIRPKFSLETKVSYKHMFKITDGIISKIFDDVASYLVFSEHLGHIKDGLGVHGVVVKYEDVFAVKDKEAQLDNSL